MERRGRRSVECAEAMVEERREEGGQRGDEEEEREWVRSMLGMKTAAVINLEI